MSVAPRYLQSKLLRPGLVDGTVRRDRLAERLRNSSAQVWLISAPAGYGKTTVVLEAIEGTDARIGWVSLDPTDNDPVRFWSHAAAAAVDNDDVLETLLDGLDPERIDLLVDDIMNAIEAMAEPIMIVLDDLHEIQDLGILGSLARILTHRPSNLTLVLVTRVDPALPIGRLRSHGQLAEIRAGDLAFTVNEAAELFGDLDDSEVSDIVETTEGWVTALRMLILSGGSDRDAHDLLRAAADGQSNMADFLAGEVLDRLPDGTKQFLVATSILDVLEPDLCDAVMDEPDSLAKLRDLARNRVFTQLVEPTTNTFRYHGLFRDFLRTRAEELPAAQLRSLHDAAARWLVDSEEPTAAIRHAIAAGDHELALATIKRHYLQYSQAGLLTTVDEWLTVFGRDESRIDPELRLMAAWAALNARKYDELDRWLEPPRGHTDTDALMVEIHAIRSHRARHEGDLEAAISEAALAAGHLVGDLAGFASVVCAAQGIAQVLAGQGADETLATAITTGQKYDIESSIVIGYSYLALSASTDPERLEEAESLADQALSYVTSPVLERFHQPAAALLVKSRAALSRGLLADAEELADKAQAIAETGREPLLAAIIHTHRARIAHRRGRADQVRALLRQAENSAGDKPGLWISEEIRRTTNDTRFAAVDSDVTLLGAVELTEKEREVLALLPHRLSRRDAATQLYMSENTLKTHLTSIRHKLALERREDIVERARALGLIPDEPAQG
jgi:LuxR family maltose regulon positive regulatory protein